MSYYHHQLKSQSLVNNDKNSSLSPENNQQHQYTIRRDESPSNFVSMTYKPFLLREDGEQKIPLFLVKLWNIVEDPSHWEVIRWDETGFSFHIMKPYLFCSDILPYYFKHKNLNSLVRQLNMYGFRKNTPIERSGLARAESDQDHLEFFHPFFRRDHPELLTNIHRKVPNSAKQQMPYHHQHQYHQLPQQPQHQLQVVSNVADVIGGGSAMDVGREETVSMRTKDLTSIFDELRTLRERQKNMEVRMDELTKENEMLWNEMAHIRGTHLKQQQIVNKLIQFLVALVGPAAATGKQSHRLGKKRHMYVLDDFGAKRLRERVGGGSGSVPSSASVPVAGGTSGGTTGGAGTVNAPPFYSTTGRFPSTSCFASTSAAAPAVPTATSIVPGTNSTRIAEPSATTTAATHANQLQSILPANATEILDRLISEIATSRDDIVNEDLEGIQIDDLSSPQSAESTNNDQQLQSYISCGNNFASALSTIRPNRPDSLHTPSSNSGPIIAEVTEESDSLNGVDSSNIGGGGRVSFQPGVPPPPPLPISSHKQQQQMVEPPQQRQQLQQQHNPNYQSYINDVVGQRRQQQQTTKYAKKDTNDGVLYQQQSQPQQQLVVYQPNQQHFIPQMSQQPPESPNQPQRQQQLVMPNQHNQQQRQPTLQQMPPHQSLSVQQQTMGGLRDQKSTSANDLHNLLLTPTTNQHEAVPSLSDGMVLSDTEMADIAGLNAFLDENGVRFNSLTNSIGEHWVNGVDDNDLQLQDLFQTVEELSSSQGHNAMTANGTNIHSSSHMDDQQQQHLFGGEDDHLDFAFDMENGNERTD